MPFNSYGYDYSPEQRELARRESIRQMGLRLMAGASKEGFAAFGPAMAVRGDAYRAELERLHEEELKRQEQEKDDRYRELQMDSMRESAEDRQARREAGDRQEADRQEEIARRHAALDAIDDPKVRDGLRLRVGQSDFWKIYDDRTAPPPPRKAPETRNFEDGTTRVWDEATGEWKVAARRPPAKSDEEKEAERERKADEKAKATAARTAEQEARKEAQKREDEYVKEWRAGVLDRAGKTLPGVARALPPDLDKRRAEFLREERERALYRHDLEGEGAPPAPAPPKGKVSAAAAAPGPPPPAVRPNPAADKARVEAAITSLLAAVPQGNRAAAERELRAAYRAGLWRP